MKLHADGEAEATDTLIASFGDGAENTQIDAAARVRAQDERGAAVWEQLKRVRFVGWELHDARCERWTHHETVRLHQVFVNREAMSVTCNPHEARGTRLGAVSTRGSRERNLTMPEKIVVLGATGNVGREVVSHLGRAGIVPRVLTRRADAQWNVPVERVVGDLSEVECLDALFKGADRVFMMSTIETPEQVDLRTIERARACDVRHVVKLSTIGVNGEGEIGRRHRVREQALEASGMKWTFLRPGYFMSNALQWVQSIRTHNKVFAPAADGALTPISPRDIAEVAALALRNDGHEGKAYVLTGEQTITAREQIALLAEITGRPIECVSIPVETAVSSAKQRGIPGWLADTLGLLWTNIAAGRAAIYDDTFRTLTGHPAETFAEWARAHRDAFV